jgi:hypothetical protein
MDYSCGRLEAQRFTLLTTPEPLIPSFDAQPIAEVLARASQTTTPVVHFSFPNDLNAEPIRVFYVETRVSIFILLSCDPAPDQVSRYCVPSPGTTSFSAP